MPKFDVKIAGLEQLTSRLRAAAGSMRGEVGSALYQFGEEVMTESKLRVPVLTGTLMNSGHVELPVDEGTRVVVQEGYGGVAAPYALYVHEALEGARPPSPNWSWTKHVARGGQIHFTRPGSGPKYLENPLKEKQDQLPGRVGAAVRRAFVR